MSVQPNTAKDRVAKNLGVPMMGNEAFARGAWEAGIKVASAYPGTPSTEILESLARYPSEDLHAQWSTNEKVALDVAIGGSFAGVRSLAAMKHVGLNVALDALMSQTYVGVHAGLVLVVCDDPGMHSSQNEQDTRLVGRLAMVPVLEPSDVQEALDYTRWAFDLSEKFDTPVIVRSTTRLSHARSLVHTGKRREPDERSFVRNPSKNVMIPSYARLRHPLLIKRESNLVEYFESDAFTRWEKKGTDVGIITSGPTYAYLKEVLPDTTVLKLAASYPLAEERILEFCRSVNRVFVVEELEPVIERELRALGIQVEGKAYFPRVGEFSPDILREGFSKAGVLNDSHRGIDLDLTPLARPPALCAGCPHISSYMALRGLNARVAGDIGCYTLAAVEPLNAIDTTISMGSSIGNAIGMAKASNESNPVVATIGDSTFLHSGIPPLIDAVYNQADITVILLDNQTTAMTGGQDHPGTGRTLTGEETHRVDFEELIRSLGVKWVKKVDSYDIGAMYQTFREATEYKGVSVVISDRPCVLDPVKIKGPPLTVISQDCTACQLCMNLGCPAISWSDEWYDGHHKVVIDEASCVGCALCPQICPANCIVPVKP